MTRKGSGFLLWNYLGKWEVFGLTQTHWVIPRPTALSGVRCGRYAAGCEPQPQPQLWLLGGFRGCAAKARGCLLLVPGLRRSTAFERTPGKPVVSCVQKAGGPRVMSLTMWSESVMFLYEKVGSYLLII
jgi:hypothetical protein